MRIQLIWSGKKPSNESSKPAPKDDISISFDPSSGFTEKIGVLFLLPWIDPGQWTSHRRPVVIEVRAYDLDLPSDFLENLQENLSKLPFVEAGVKTDLVPGWNPVPINNLQPGTEYSFLILAGYDS